MNRTRVAEAEELWPGEMRQISVSGQRLLFVNVEGELHAYQDRCAHQGVELSRGRLEGRTLTCWAHGWQYDICAGMGLNPTTASLQRCPVSRVGTEVWVDIDA
jgi:toluene monooxygenase system ferredoxin subunit